MKNLVILGAFVATVVLWTTKDQIADATRNLVREEFRSHVVVHSPHADRVATVDEFWSGVIARGKAIEIRGINGDVQAQPTDGELVEVRIEKRSRRSAARQVRVEIVEHDGGVTLCAVYPTPRDERENYCAPGSGGRLNSRNNDVRVNFIVSVPEGVKFIAHTVNGEIDATNLRSDAEAETVNGDIRLTTTGFGKASTVNGSIFASVDQIGNGLDFETVNGNITLRLPEDGNADIEGVTVSGSISSDFPISITGTLGPKQMRGTLGAGGPEITLETVTGNIRLEVLER